MVKVNREADRRANRATHFANPVRRERHGLHRFVDRAIAARPALIGDAIPAGPLLVRHAGAEAEKSPSFRDRLARLLDDVRPGETTGGSEAADFGAARAAEQLIDRHAERLAEDVVERDVNRRDDRPGDLATLEVVAAIQDLPEVLDLARIASDEDVCEVVEHSLHRQLAPGDAALPDTGNPFVRLDLDDETIPMPDPDRMPRDRRDFHRCPSSPTQRAPASPLLTGNREGEQKT